MFLKRSINFYFAFFIATSIQFNLAAQDEECDLACKYKKLQDLKSDEAKGSTTSSYQDRENPFLAGNSKAFISNKAEVQRWLDEITEWKLYYDGEPINEFETEMKVGSVRGDIDGFRVNDFKITVDPSDTLGTDQIIELSIDEISFRDKDSNGFLNKRISLDEYIEIISSGYSFEDTYAMWTANIDMEILGLEFGQDVLDELSSDPELSVLTDINFLDSTSLIVRQKSSYSDVSAEIIYDFNQVLQVAVEAGFPKPRREDFREFYENVMPVLYEMNSQYTSNECQTDYSAYKEEAEEEIPYSVFVGDYIVCYFASSLDTSTDLEDYTEFLEVYTSEEFFDLLETFSFTFSLSWSKDFWDAASIASGGSLDAGIFAANTFLATKMSKFELVALLDGLGIPYEYKGLFEDLLYDYYSDFYSEAKEFISFPRGLAFSVELLEPINPEILYQLEDNPMLLFNILNKIRFEVKANPRFKNL
tara:strand:- start:1141 stop:2568 length:1428 start_codon:yes stop_codon:yes gene_type:complete